MPNNVVLCRPDGKPPGFAMKAVLGMAAGTVGAFVGTPAEVQTNDTKSFSFLKRVLISFPKVSLIRMTADGRLPPAERRNYKHVGDALVRMVKEEGILTLWRGAIPTMARAMVVNAAQLASYSQAKQSLLETGESTFCTKTPSHLA